MINHNKIYIAPSHTKKVFANMKRQGNDFSSKVTPLFSTKMVQAQQEQGEENLADEAVYEERDDSLERATTTTTGLDAEQDRCNISKTQSKATPNEPSSIGTSSGGGPRVIDLENTKTAQAQKITSLKKRVKKLERKKKARTRGLKRLYKVGLSARIDSSDDEASLGDQKDASKQGRKIHDIDANEDITLKNVHDADMFGALAELKSTKPKAVTTAAITTITAVIRPKAKGLVIQEQEQASTPITSSKDKGKGIMVEEPLKMKMKDQVLFDEQEAIRLQAQFDKEERIAREKEEVNATLIAQWNNIQDKVETDYELAQRLQTEEQEKFYDEQLERRKKGEMDHPLICSQRSIMCTYLKNMVGWKPKELKTKSFANVQELFHKVMKRVNTFVYMNTELVGGSEVREESSSKRAGDELELELSKKQKVDDDKETEELKQCMEIISDDGDDVTIEATPLSIKSPTIVDYKIYKEGKVHCVTMQNILYYLLVEKMYPLTKHTLHQMLNDVKLQVDYECEMAFELLRLVKKQLKEGYVPQ
ncbi:hypothetical protein Tco_0348965 [Tanacetum coccineum]